MSETLDEFFTYMPPADSIWKCPCGYTATYAKVRSHRKGFKKRPDCVGKMVPNDPEAIAQTAWGLAMQAKKVDKERERLARQPKYPVTDPESLKIDLPPIPQEPTPEEEAVVDDPEEFARRYNEYTLNQIRPTEEDFGYPGDGEGGDGGDIPDLPDGDWVAEPPSIEAPTSLEKISVRLPLKCRMIYDYAIGEGWDEGNRTFDTFVTSVLFDWFENTLGMGIFVAPIEEVISESRIDYQRPTGKSTTPDPTPKR